MIPQYFFDDGTLNQMQCRLLQCVQRSWQTDLERGFAVHELDGGVKQLADVVDASPYFRDATVAPSSPYTASIAVRTEYSVVNTVSRGVSANWPRNAKFTQPSGITSGRSPFVLGMKNAVI